MNLTIEQLEELQDRVTFAFRKVKELYPNSKQVNNDFREIFELIQAEIDRQSITDEKIKMAIHVLQEDCRVETEKIGSVEKFKQGYGECYLLAIDALKQMGGKEPCEWCDLDNKRETNTGSGFYMGFKKDPFDNDKVKFFIGETIFKIMVVRFNYCPNCGRGL